MILKFLLCAIGVQSLAHHLLEESNWHRAPLSNVYFKCGGYLGRKSVVSAKNVVLNEIFSTKNLAVWKIKGIFAFIF